MPGRERGSSAMSTNIKWCTETWNPVVGCWPVSPGCKNCYAARMATRLVGIGGAGYAADGEQGAVAKGGKWTGVVRCLPDKLDQPRRWRKPKRIFVCSMSDLFHEDVPNDFLDRIFDVMEDCERHTFQVLTKRPKRLHSWLAGSDVGKNIWLGTSVEDRRRLEERVPPLAGTRAAVCWLSVEPLLGPLGLIPADLYGIDWVVVGGESGPDARPMHADWVREIRDACIAADVPFFFKQWGGARQPPKDEPVLLDDREWLMYPGDRHA